ncbi:hypothetical protein N8843_00355 [Verrucomicrobia bacterium]|nr:hypothetical protein [Verrucomicrobiota bacterium]MDA7669567.1 hypothetical protein [bacterium]
MRTENDWHESTDRTGGRLRNEQIRILDGCMSGQRGSNWQDRELDEENQERHH